MKAEAVTLLVFSTIRRSPTIEDAVVVNGTDSDSLIVFEPETQKWLTLRVPYPMGFYTRYVDGRNDDPQARWKGRGLWATNEPRVIWHVEGG